MSKKNKQYMYKGSVHMFEEQKPQKSFADTVGEWIVGAGVIILIFALLGSCSKDAHSNAKAGGVKPPVIREASFVPDKYRL